MPELTDSERVALLTARLGLAEGALRQEAALEALRHGSFVHERRLAGAMMASKELQEKLQGTHRAGPVYQVLDAPGPQHARTFEVEVQFQGAALGRGSGRTKKEAEQAAAKAALDAGLPDLAP